MTIKEHSHTPEAIAQRLMEGPKETYVREWVYGGIDGVVTTFAIIAAVLGAQLSPIIVVIMGLANLIGDGFSMAASSYSANKTEQDNYDRLRAIEKNHIHKHPEGELEETRQIFENKGFEGENLNEMVRLISQDENTWIDFMLAEEYGVSKPSTSPLKVGLHTFTAFCVCGFMPLMPFLFYMPYAPYISFTLAALTFFAIGSGKSIWSIKSWWKEGLETLTIGIIAAALAYYIGVFMEHLVE